MDQVLLLLDIGLLKMSKLVARYDVVAKQYILDVEDLSPSYADIFAGIDNGGSLVIFSNFACGYELSKGGQIISSKSWPEPGVTYIESSDPLLVSDRVYWNPGDVLDLMVWFENVGVHIQHTWTIQVPEEPVVVGP